MAAIAGSVSLRTRRWVAIALTVVVVAGCWPAAQSPSVPPPTGSIQPSVGASLSPSPDATPSEQGTTEPVPSASPTASHTASRAPANGPASAVLVTHGRRDRRWIALTFDADMTQGMLARLHAHQVASWYDARIVAELRASGAPATVFLTGLWAQAYPDIVRSLAADPLFEIENHSFDHAAFRTPCYGLPAVSTDAARRKEVTDGASAISAAGGGTPIYFRFPGGCHATADLGLVAGLGETPVGWDVVSGDAFQPDPKVIDRQVLARVQPGSIIVMHLMGAPNAPATADALATLIPQLQARGYEFVTLRELLAG